ncbi:MAG: PLP-dependent aminotransferase family protein [Pseudomonadota bacterium]|nr:PLP-dependent aminotransferase family protein [Pseudomonadota bacterium]
MAIWHPHLQTEAGKKYLGIVRALEADIYAGRIKPGDRLPSQRAIAEALQVDLTTVTRAFNEARRRGLVEGNKGSGTYIRDSVQQQLIAEKHALLDLSMNNPPQPASAQLQQRLPEGISGLIADERRMLQLQYQDSAGNPADREAALYWLQQHNRQADAEQVLIAAGAQSALYAICKCLISAGKTLLTPEYSYPGLKAVAEQLNIKLQAVICDAEGVLPEALEAACQGGEVSALYLIPALDNPTTVTMTLQRRQVLAEIARRYEIAIIEDDPYSPLQCESVPAFNNLLPKQTWHIATLSKCATPALRVAFVVTPSKQATGQLAAVLRATNLMAPPLMCALVTRWIYDGTLDDIASAIRLENNQRQKLAAELLVDHQFAADPDGHHLWLFLPAHWRADDYARAAYNQGVTIVPASQFAITQTPIDAVRVSLGIASDSNALRQAMTILASLLNQTEQPQRVVV